MEEDMLSMISYAKANMNEESSDSNCSIDISHPNNKRRRVIERFKGVVPQQNGHWGAQIYANHQRMWLGTFKSEVDAAMAYDSATIKLRSGDYSHHRNFPSPNTTLQETKFQAHFSTDDILSMIRDGSYRSKFSDFLRNKQGRRMEIGGLNPWSVQTDGGFSCTLLFQKELTPSDVGKLNRLVIPKRYALKHFPKVLESTEQQQNLDDAQRVGQVELEFYDMQMSLWKFRYCYWKSSQSFVFTRGWNRFVKEKGLRANDTLAFYTCRWGQGGRHFGKPFLVVDVASRRRRNSIDHNNTMKLDIRRKQDKFVERLDDSTPSNESKGFRLFGVQIDRL
ncbi:hypothetical protein OROGR_014980 [Orobanche gracilis]